MLRFESNVSIIEFRDCLGVVLREASLFSLTLGIGVDVNSIDDGQHKNGTLHGLSSAIDLDTEGDRDADLEALFQWMRKRLPPGYDVVMEWTHVHVECDPHRAEFRMPATKPAT